MKYWKKVYWRVFFYRIKCTIESNKILRLSKCVIMVFRSTSWKKVVCQFSYSVVPIFGITDYWFDVFLRNVRYTVTCDQRMIVLINISDQQWNEKVLSSRLCSNNELFCKDTCSLTFAVLWLNLSLDWCRVFDNNSMW